MIPNVADQQDMGADEMEEHTSHNGEKPHKTTRMCIGLCHVSDLCYIVQISLDFWYPT